MILSNNNGTFTPVAGGTGTFIGTKAAFNAVKDTLPENTVAYITDDGNGDLQPVDAVTNGDMHPVTSNAVYDVLNTVETGTVANGSDCYIGYTKVGRVVSFSIHAKVATIGTGFALPFSCIRKGEGIKTGLFWGGNCYGECYLQDEETLLINCSSESSGELVCILK